MARSLVRPLEFFSFFFFILVQILFEKFPFLAMILEIFYHIFQFLFCKKIGLGFCKAIFLFLQSHVRINLHLFNI